MGIRRWMPGDATHTDSYRLEFLSLCLAARRHSQIGAPAFILGPIVVGYPSVGGYDIHIYNFFVIFPSRKSERVYVARAVSG